MKNFYIVVCMLSIGWLLYAVVSFNEDLYIPNTLTVCFKFQVINSNIGDISITKDGSGIVQIGIKAFD
jgi:hypothetical protein